MNIGIVAEGPTDQIVLEAIIKGVRGAVDDDLEVHPIRPTRSATDSAGPGGWELVFEWVRLHLYREALQLNDVVVIQVDTDVCEHPNFAVPRQQAGRACTDLELVAAVIARLAGLIDPTFLANHANRFVFAIAVDEIECWLLPLLFDNNKAGKTTGCLEAASHELRRQSRPGLSAGEVKFPAAYHQVARDFRKRKHVDAARAHSPSLDLFVTDLERRCSLLAPPATDSSS